MGAGTSIIAGYISHKISGGHSKQKKSKTSKHRLRNAGKKAQKRTNNWRQKRADRSRFE